MKKWTAFTLALMMSAGVAVAADGFHGKPHHHPAHPHVHAHKHKSDLPRGFEELNLSDEQKKKIQTIAQEFKTQHAQLKAEHPKAPKNQVSRHEKEQELFKKAQFDETAARAMIAERQQVRLEMEKKFADLELHNLKKRHAILQVLTEEQKKQYFSNMENRRKQHQQMFEKHQKMRDGAPKSESK